MTRRKFLYYAAGLSAVGATALYARGMMGGVMGERGMEPSGMGAGMMGSNTLGAVNNFFNPLHIPPEIKGELRGGVRHYDFDIQEGYREFIRGLNTPTYGINGNYLGPTIRLKQGEEVSLNWQNNLGEATTMHGHGMHVPAIMDGGVHQIIEPGTKWSARYKVNQKACTNWYHPHMMGKTAEHVLMGLGGMIFIDDDESLNHPLPKRYGVDDIPLVIQDRSFASDGSFIYNKNMMTVMHGYHGDTLLVNGTVAPYLEVEANLLRLRLLNASNARVYNFAVAGVKNRLIASDNSFLERAESVGSVVLSPAERVEVVVDLRRVFAKKLYLVDRESGAKVLEIRVNKRAQVRSAIPSKLTTLETINLRKVAKKRRFVLETRGPGRLLINRKRMDPKRVDERIKVGEYEIWEVKNAPMGMGMMKMGMTHNFHMHAGHFRVIARDGSKRKVLPWERGYKDTVRLGVGERVTLLVKHSGYIDSQNPYMYHCHILEHEDAGMMGQFTVEDG